jgi:glycerophosphoryl diester phosphodiesterase
MRPLRIGHRGAAGHAPENTIVSIELALSMGADAVEIDVQRTRDGRLVVIHDWRVDPLTNGQGYVRDLDFAQLRLFRTIDGNQQIPSLAEVLEAVDNRGGLIIEIKSPNIASPVAAAVREANFRGPVFFASFLHDELLRVREVEPHCKTVALLDGVPVHRTAFIQDARATHAGVAYNCLSRAFVRAIHDAGFQVFTYTANELDEIAHARDCEVDGIISNYPDRL